MFNFSIAILFHLFAYSSVYDKNVTTVAGVSQPLSAYEGKKLLIVTLPLERNASSDSLLFSLDTLASAHASDLQVIATPSFEDGYDTLRKDSLIIWYRSKLSSQVIITEGMYTRKTSGNLQHPLFFWLTYYHENGRFNMDITDKEYKFFINTDGKIYGVLRPQSKMWGQTLNRVINTPVITEG